MFPAFTIHHAKSGLRLCNVTYIQGTGDNRARYQWFCLDGKHEFPVVGKAALADAISASYGYRVTLSEVA